MITFSKTARNAALALSLGLTLSACGGMPTHRGLESVNQPVVTRTNYTLDVASGVSGLPLAEQRRLAGWFEAMDLRYGDVLSIDDPTMNPVTRAAVQEIANRHGILVSDAPAPVTQGYVAPGAARVVVTRASATVPGCPDWSAKSDANYNNATSPGYGCSINGNLAAMVANPEDLVKGQQGTGETVILTSTKAIEAYRSKAPTGNGGLQKDSSSGGGGN